MKMNWKLLATLLLLALSPLARAQSQWVLEQSTLAYHVSHPLHESEGVSHAARGKGVCQDFAHTMIALLRQVRIPARYVSGYLFRGREDHDRSTPDASHAWVEVLLPHLGWIGFDPTNNLIAHHRHIRTAVGRDYADVPPTHGVFRGSAESELYVAVQVDASDEAPALDRKMPIPEDWSVLVERAQQPPVAAIPFTDLQAMQQQQQQQ